MFYCLNIWKELCSITYFNIKRVNKQHFNLQYRKLCFGRPWWNVYDFYIDSDAFW